MNEKRLDRDRIEALLRYGTLLGWGIDFDTNPNVHIPHEPEPGFHVEATFRITRNCGGIYHSTYRDVVLPMTDEGEAQVKRWLEEQTRKCPP